MDSKTKQNIALQRFVYIFTLLYIITHRHKK